MKQKLTEQVQREWDAIVDRAHQVECACNPVRNTCAEIDDRCGWRAGDAEHYIFEQGKKPLLKRIIMRSKSKIINTIKNKIAEREKQAKIVRIIKEKNLTYEEVELLRMRDA